MTLYEELGVEREASPDEIKAAYRKKAQDTHPDRDGGSEEAFRRVQHAYEVLSDPERRAKYDADGHDGKPDDLRDLALQSIAAMVIHLVDEVENPAVDLVEKMKADTSEVINSQEQQIVQLYKRIAKRERVATKFLRKLEDGETNFLASIVHRDIVEKKKRIEDVKQSVKIARLMIEILNEYGFEAWVTESVSVRQIGDTTIFSLGKS